MWINRRLYLESLIEIHELLILPYMLDSIEQDNSDQQDNKSILQEAQDNRP